MSNRFHSKFHRANHHTYPNASNPDAGHDPIASYDNPFRGDFVLTGALSAVVPSTSAYAAAFIGGNVGIGTAMPNVALTVIGSILNDSLLLLIFAKKANSSSFFEIKIGAKLSKFSYFIISLILVLKKSIGVR